VSPLRIFAERAYQRLQDDRLLPNSRAGTVVKGRLQNGDVMLFAQVDVAQFQRSAQRPTTPEATSLSQLAAELKREDVQLLVVIFPSAYTVYAPLLETPALATPAGTSYLDRLEAELQTAGAPVVPNGTVPGPGGRRTGAGHQRLEEQGGAGTAR
jgi:hypothetical protein